jgi:hypothetical protein
MLSLLGLHYRTRRFQSTDRMSEAYNDQKLQLLRYYIEQCKHAWLVCKNEAGHVVVRGLEYALQLPLGYT